MKKVICMLPALMLLAIAATLSGCGDSEDDNSSDIRANAQRIDTCAITPTFVYGSYLINHPGWREYYEDSWGAGGTTFDVFILQGNAFANVGRLHSIETSIAKADLKKAIHLGVPVPAGINTNMPYQIIAIHAPGTTALSNGNIVHTMELERGDLYCGSWYLMEGGASTTSKSSYLTNFEGLQVLNSTSETIKVRHKGYDAKEKWYYTKATVSITPGLKIEVNGQSGEEAVSPEMEIKAGEKICIDSRYVANGKKMTDASLILEIDGKEVRTEPASSDISIEDGTPCFLYVKWDGKNLMWN